VIEYDVSDQAGNDAEQISFGLVMRDTIAPEYLLSTVTEAEYGDADPFPDILLSSFKDSYDGTHISVDLATADGVHRETLTNAFADEDGVSSFAIPNYHGYNCVESTITAVASDYADIFGEHNLDNKFTVQLQYNLNDATPPTIDTANIQVEDMECNGESHDIGHITGVAVSDKSCHCNDQSQSQFLTQVDGSVAVADCQYHCATLFSRLVSITSIHVGTVDITCTARDYQSLVATASVPSFDVTDTTPPHLDIITNSDPEENFQGMDAAGVSFNFQLTERENQYEHDITIQHHAGYFGDENAFMVLLHAFSCVDACTPEAKIRTSATWHAHESGTTCAEMPDVSHWDLVELIHPGTFVIKYSCVDESGNLETACRTIFNEGIASHIPTSVPTTIPTSVPTSIPTSSPTFQACDPGIAHSCETSSTYCGVEENDDGSNSVICACLPGYLDDPHSEYGCIATEAPTASPTDSPTAVPTALPTAMPTIQVVVPDFTNITDSLRFKLIYQANAIADMQEVYNMVQAFIYFWSGDKIAMVQAAVDYYEISLGNDYPAEHPHNEIDICTKLVGSADDFAEGCAAAYTQGISCSTTFGDPNACSGRVETNQCPYGFDGPCAELTFGEVCGATHCVEDGRRLESGFERVSTRHQQGDPTFMGAELVDDRGNTRRWDGGSRRLEQSYDPFADILGVNTSDGWNPVVNFTEPHVQQKMKDYAMSIGATCPEFEDPNLNIGCEPRSSPNMWDLTFTIYINMGASMGISCLKDSVSQILDSNGGNVPGEWAPSAASV
jgi:hypothetical protein